MRKLHSFCFATAPSATTRSLKFFFPLCHQLCSVQQLSLSWTVLLLEEKRLSACPREGCFSFVYTKSLFEHEFCGERVRSGGV